MTVTITREVGFDYGHRVHRHGGKCAHLHGHRARLVVTVTGPIQTDGPATGMVVDFGLLRADLDSLADLWDHRLLIASDDPWLPVLAQLDTMVVVTNDTPTAEWLAAEAGGVLQRVGYTSGYELVSCTFYETPNSWATWTP